MKTKHFIACVVAFAPVCAFSANLGTLDLSTGSAGFTNTPIGGAFTDTLSFILTTSSVANGSLTSAVNGSQDVDFTSIQLSGPSGSFSLVQSSGDPVEVWSLPAAGVSLTPGTYTLSLTGVNSASGGSYGGNFAVTALAVPEPESYVMLLAGLGLMGFVGRRRKHKAAKFD